MVKLNNDELNLAEGRAKRFSDYVYERVRSVTNLPAYEETFTDYFKSLKLSKRIHHCFAALGVMSVIYSLGIAAYANLKKNESNPIYVIQTERTKLTDIILYSPVLSEAGLDTVQINNHLRNKIKTLDSEIEELMQTDVGRKIREQENLKNKSVPFLYAGFGVVGLSKLRKKLYKPYIKSKTRKKLEKLTSKQLANGADLEIPSNFE